MTVSARNVETVRSLFPPSIDLVEVWETSFPDEYWDAFEPDFEVEFLPRALDVESPVFTGKAGIEEGWRDWLEPWESYRGDVEDIIEAGDDVIVTAHITARARRGGVAFEHPAAVVVTFRDGKVRRLRFYLDRADAFRDLGIEPPA